MTSCHDRECGSPARATLIVDWNGIVRYMAAHRTDIPRSFILVFLPIQSVTIIAEHTCICHLQIFAFQGTWPRSSGWFRLSAILT